MCQISRKEFEKFTGPTLAHSHYFEVLCSCKLRNLSNSTFEIAIVITVLSQDSRLDVSRAGKNLGFFGNFFKVF